MKKIEKKGNVKTEMKKKIEEKEIFGENEKKGGKQVWILKKWMKTSKKEI